MQIMHVARDGSGDYTSIKAALAAINGPYEIRLKRGDNFAHEGAFTLESNGTLTNYGSGQQRPIVEKINTLNEHRDVFSDVLIDGIEFEHGVRMIAGCKRVTLRNCKLNLSELICQAYAGMFPEQIKLQRSIFTGAYTKTSSYSRSSRPSNSFVAGIKGLLIEECVYDHGGWHDTEEGAAANMFNHDLYIQYSNAGNEVVVRNNIFTRASSHGVHGRPGGTYEDNLFAKCAISLQMGYKNHPLPKGIKAIARRNVITQPRTMVKGNKPGAGEGLLTPALWGIYIDEPGEGEFILEGNRVHWEADNETAWRTKYSGLNTRPISIHKAARVTKNDTIVVANGRTLDDYAAHLGIPGGFDGFMAKVLNRGVDEWDERLTAKAANAYLRGGVSTAPTPDPVKELPPEVIKPTPTPAPTSGGVVTVIKGDPMEIQAELFTHYHDTTPENQGNTGAAGPVDTVQQGDVTYVGWTYAGEYLEYALDVAAAQLYDLALIAGTGRKEPQPMAVMIDGVDVGTINVAPGSWTAFAKSESLRIGLSAGKHTIRLTFVTGGVNLDKMSLTPFETVREVLPAGVVRVDVGGKKLAIWSE